MRLEWQTTGEIFAWSCDLWPGIHVTIIEADPTGAVCGVRLCGRTYPKNLLTRAGNGHNI